MSQLLAASVASPVALRRGKAALPSLPRGVLRTCTASCSARGRRGTNRAMSDCVSRLAWIGGLVALGFVVTARPAAACGGTFCGTGPQAQPVDQTGENILFVPHDAGTISAHVQIQYTGEPAEFAWIIPLPSEPDIAIGSQPLFDNLLSGTVPTYQVLRQGCRSLAGAEGGGSVGDVVDTPVGPTVLSHQTVGSFEVTVLSGGTADELVQWLSDNEFDNVPDAPELFQHYIDAGLVFAAIRLVAGAGLDSIHPIEFRYAGTRPAIPIILTSVAAVDDMAIRVFVLGDERYVPTNYQHIELNPVRIDWQQFASNYSDVLARAVDSEGADGHAFVTEYAGLSAVVNSNNLYNTSWNAEPLITADPLSIPSLLESYGLFNCAAATCTFNHPLMLPLLREFLPAPAGVDEEAFYDCPRCYAPDLVVSDFDGAAFARAFNERIVVPGRDAQQQLLDHPYLTRMLTLLSPDEMTIDPTFHPDANAPDVAALQSATWQLACSAEAGAFTVGDWEVALTEDAAWPAFDSDMPYTLRVESFFEDGLSDAFIDNTDAITAWLADWNESREWPPEPEMSEQEPPLIFDGTTDPTLGAPTSGGAGNDPDTSSAQNDGGADDETETEEDERRRGSPGCAVVEHRDVDWSLWCLALTLAFVAVRRRTNACP